MHSIMKEICAGITVIVSASSDVSRLKKSLKQTKMDKSTIRPFRSTTSKFRDAF